jgi:hypothetical protein
MLVFRVGLAGDIEVSGQVTTEAVLPPKRSRTRFKSSRTLSSDVRSICSNLGDSGSSNPTTL